MRAGIAIAALLGVVSLSVAAQAQSPVYQDACGGGCAPAASACGGGSCLSGVNLGYRDKARQVLNPTLL